MFGLGVQELLIILGILLLLFGARRLPELGRSLGKSLRSFKAGVSDADTKPLPESDSQTDSAGTSAGLPQDERERAERKQS